MEFILELLSVLVLVGFVMKKKFDDFAALYEHIPHDKIVPFFGHSLVYAFKTPAEVFKTASKNLKRIGPTALLIIGFKATVVFNDPKDVAEVLSSRKWIRKSEFYRLLKDWLGNGLLLSEGKRWASMRKILTPAYHFNTLEDYVSIFDANSSILVEKLKGFKGKPFVDIYHHVALFTLDVMCETSMGVSIKAQSDSKSEYVKALKK